MIRYEPPSDATNLEKAFSALLNDPQYQFIGIDKAEKCLHLHVDNWNITLYANGKWDMH